VDSKGLNHQSIAASVDASTLLAQIVQTKRLQVLLRCRDVLVAEERLQRLDVDARLEHLCGEGAAPLVQVELLAKRPVAAFPLLGLAPLAIQPRSVGDLFPEFEQVCVGHVAAIILTFRVRRGREEQRRALVLLRSRTQGFQKRRGDRHGPFFVALRC
jgi:hypothetical protein